MYFFKFLKSAILSSAAAVSTQAVSESAGDLVSTIQHPNFQALRHSNAGTNLTSKTYVTHSSETRLNKELQRLVEVSAPFTLAKSFML